MSGTNKPAMKRIGVFSEPGYTTIGQGPESPKAGKGGREQGSQMITAVSKKGKTWKGCYFSKPGRLFEGDEYMTWGEIQRRNRNETNKKLVGGTPWRPSNPSKKQSGSGDFYGTCSGKVPYICGKPEDKLKREDVQEKPANITTNPAKKGSFGTFGTVLGYRKGYKGAAGEFEYHADPIREPVRQAKSDDAPPPFRPARSTPKGTAGYNVGYFSKIEYVSHGTREARRRPKTEGDEKSAWRPGGGRVKSLSKGPEYVEDPFEGKELAAKSDREKHYAKVAGRPGFTAMGTTHSKRTPSVFKMNIRV